METKIGWKIFTKYNNNLYSYLLGRLYGEEILSILESRVIKYDKENFTEGKPWIALFKTKNSALRWVTCFEPLPEYSPFIILKVEYYPLKKAEIFNFLDFRDVQNIFLNSSIDFEKAINTKYIDFTQLPPGTIFASKIKIIRD